jgi:hypothetical protein
LKACDGNLSIALQSLLDCKTAERGTSDHAWNPPALSILSA